MSQKKDAKKAAEPRKEAQAAEGQMKKEEVKENPLQARVDELEAKVGELEEGAAELSDKLAKEKDSYLRLMAEFENFRRRSSEERLSLVGTAAADTIKGLLPVLDDCERAMTILESSQDEAAKEGTKLIYDKLSGYLKTRGLEVIKAKGEKFDTDFHEAVTQFPVEDEKQKGMVIDVIQNGYTLNGKILRYAKVIVGA